MRCRPFHTLTLNYTCEIPLIGQHEALAKEYSLAVQSRIELIAPLQIPDNDDVPFNENDDAPFNDDDDEPHLLPDLDDELTDEQPKEKFNFVEAPEKVQKVEIGYAKKAKSVDIKGLKKDVWDLLCESGEGAGATSLTSEVSFQSVVSKLDEKVRSVSF